MTSAPSVEDPDHSVQSLIDLVGKRVLEARQAAGLSRRELSERSGVSQRYLAQLESGAGNISIGLLQKVAVSLGQGIEALVAPEDPLSQDIARIAMLYRAADSATRARVLQGLDPDRMRAQKAQRICLVGLRGAGKSTLGAGLGEEFGLPFIELNAEIEASAGIPVGEIIALYGQEGYRQLEADILADIIAGKDKVVLAVGGGIVAEDATYSDVLARFHTIWLTADPAEHMERVRAQGDLRPMAGNPQAMAQLRQILKTREAQYRRADLRLDTSGADPETSLSQLCALVRVHQILDPS